MMFPFSRRSARPDTISALYGTIVTQARMPSFYQDYAVADTVNGRFDLVVLHLTLVLGRLWGDPALRDLGQGLFDRFCQDMDHNLREMGIGDLAVPKHMQRMGEAFYGRAEAYRAALASSDNMALTETVARNVYGGAAAATDAPSRLAAYIRETVVALAALETVRLAAGDLTFPDPISTLKKSS